MRKAKAGRRPRSSAIRLDEYEELARKVDAFFARVVGAYGGEMRCAAGCAECCAHHLTVSVVEAAAIAREIASFGAGDRARLKVRAESLRDADGPCPALEPDGRCGIYDARPLVCRSHGAPLRVPAGGALPVLGQGPGSGDESRVACCHLNFTGQALEEVDPSCVLDLVNMAATLAVVNARATGDGQSAALRRIRIGDVLRAAHSP